MKTLKQVTKEYPEYKTIINSVIRKIGMNSVEDVINHGIAGGFNGFIHTSDTVKFWKSHKKDILQMAKDVSSDLGENLIEMIGGFNCLKYYDYDNEKWTDKEGQEAIMHTIYGRKTDDIVANAMSWFAAEEVCQMFE